MEWYWRTHMEYSRIVNYPSALVRASLSAIKVGMPPMELLRYMNAYTKNARAQLGFPEKFDISKIRGFKTKMGKVFFRDNRADPATLAEIVENQYEFSHMEGNGCLVDAGACIGMSSLVFSAFNPDKKIFCFEPMPESARVIPYNCPKAKVYTKWIGRKQGKREVYMHPINNMGLPEKEEGCITKEVEVCPLDSFADEFGEVAMLKIDVEGSEIDVLEGAQKVLEKTGGVRMETHSKKLHEESINTLEERGFGVWKSYFKGEIGYVFAKRKN